MSESKYTKISVASTTSISSKSSDVNNSKVEKEAAHKLLVDTVTRLSQEGVYVNTRQTTSSSPLLPVTRRAPRTTPARAGQPPLRRTARLHLSSSGRNVVILTKAIDNLEEEMEYNKDLNNDCVTKDGFIDSGFTKDGSGEDVYEGDSSDKGGSGEDGYEEDGYEEDGNEEDGYEEDQ